MRNITNITPPRVPLTDPATGLISREWYRFFLNLFTLTGSGTFDATVNDLLQGPQPQAEVFAEINRIYNEALLASQPVQLGTLAALNQDTDALLSIPSQQLGTLAAVNQDNVRFLGFQTTPELGYTPPVGTAYWNGGTTLTIQNTPNVAQPIGEAQYYYIKAAANITKGQLIMFAGSVGASGQLKGAPATGVATGEYLMGVAAEDIPINKFGVVTSFGLVRGFNTTGGAEAWTDGTILYYNPAVPGGMTKTIPTAPNVKAVVAAVVNAASGGSGSVFVRVSFGSKLGETDSNVQITSLADKQFLQYDAALGYWKNISATGAGLVTSFSGGTTGLTPSTPAGGDVVLGGTLALTNGGTGQTTRQAAINALTGAVTSGQYLRGDGTNVVMSAIQAADVPTLNQNTTGTAANVTGVVAIANGGTGQTTQQLAINALAGSATSGQYLRGNGTNVVMSAIQASDVPTLNQNTTGTASNVTGVVAIANGGTGQTTQQAALNALSGAVTSGQYLRGNGTNVTLSAIQAADVPTLNQNTTGTASNVTGVVAVANGGTGLTTIAANRIPYASALDTYATSANFTYDGTTVSIGTTATSGFSLVTNLPIFANAQNTNITPSLAANWGGQLTGRGNGYAGGIALDASGMWVGHTSSGRALLFAIASTAVARFDTAGYFLVGTATSKSLITMALGSGATYYGAGAISDYLGNTGFQFYHGSTGNCVIFNTQGSNAFGNILFATSAGEAARVTNAGGFRVTGADGIGYGTGSGGTVTQATSRTTGVTINKTNGAITLVSAAGSTTYASFTVTNSTVAVTDTVIVSQRSGTDLYEILVTAVAAGSFRITFRTTGGTTTEQPVFNFAVIKAVNA